MNPTLVVLIDDAVAGTLTRQKGGALRFEYEDEYRSRADATPLSISMSPRIRVHSDGVVTPWLWGLLPDNDAVLARWGRDFQVSTSSPFSLLATPIGRDCPGAVRFVTPDEVDEALSPDGNTIWLTDEQVAQRLRDLREDSTAWLGDPFTGQFSLAGAQAKTALLWEDGKWGVPSGASATSHILKPAVAGLAEHDVNEHLCLDAARRAGLLVAHTRIERFEDQTAIVVERYDRRHEPGTLRRVHQEDLCQAMSVHPARKYQNEGGPGPADIVDLFRGAMATRAADDAVMRFCDALIWNWLIAGTDAHAKNYSLLLAGSETRLAPLYDIASALPYAKSERDLRFAMKIGGDYRVAAYRSTWIAAAGELGLEASSLVERVRELAALAPDAFSDAAADEHMATLGSELPSRLVDAVADRAAKCSSLLA